jgi:hypothetical protein
MTTTDRLGRTVINAAGTDLLDATQIVTTSSDTIESSTTVVAIERAAPFTTALALPSGLDGQRITIVDWSTSVTSHTVTITPDGDQTIMLAASWEFLSDATRLGAVTLHFNEELDGWYVEGATESITTDPAVAIDTLMSDTFTRTTSAGSLGNADTGQAWSLSGVGASAAHVDGSAFVTTGNTYAGVLLASPIMRLSCKFVILSGTGGPTLQISADSSITLTNMVHLLITTSGCTPSWWQGASQNNLFTNGVNSTWETALSTGVEYEVAVTIEGDTVTIEGPNGEVFTFYDTHVSEVVGSLAVVQLGDANVKATEVSVQAENPLTIYGQLHAKGGLQGTPVGSARMARGIFSQVGIGSYGPSALLHVSNPAGLTNALGLFESIIGANVTIKTTGVGYAPSLSLSQGQADPPKIYSSGSASDIRIYVNSADVIVISAFGGTVVISRTIAVTGINNSGGSGIGKDAISSAWEAIAAGTTAKAQINLASSTAPTSPNDGDIWFDGTNLKIRISGVTKTVTVT